VTFLRAAALDALSLEHGFGALGSDSARVPGLCTARQVHGADVLRVPPARPASEADALVTTVPGVAVGVRTADCVPILLAAGQRGVAAVHAGWRGSAARVVERAVRSLCDATGVAPAALTAVIGPHIGPCCYEVDAPVREAFGDEKGFTPARAGHWWLDLGGLNEVQLMRSGVRRVVRVGECTCCSPERYASYRRDGSGERMLHYIRL